MVGIYKITNPNGKIYIGQSSNLETRWRYYKNLSCKGQVKLLRSLKKYGFDSHKIEIVEECSIEQLNEREIFWGTKFNVLGKNGLNLRLGSGRGSCSEETKLKISKSNKGKNLGVPKPQSFIDKIRKIQKGSKRSQEIKDKMSLAQTGLIRGPQSEDHKKKISLGNKGKTRSKKALINMSLAKKGVAKPKGFSDKIRKIKQGKSHPLIRKAVVQLNDKGKIIKEFNSAKEAELHFFPNKKPGDCIGRSCRKGNKAYGFNWRFK